MPQFNTPILFIMFNRPHHARRVFNELRKCKPTQLYIAVDGPRTSERHHEDVGNVIACRQLVDEIDWPCTTVTLFREHNVGCKIGVSSAIDWFFSHVEQGIILEDDCLPDPTFFTFCQDLLERYKEDNRVMHIGGSNLAPEQHWGVDSYVFTKVCHIWGWATWRRAWQHYDVTMATFPAVQRAGKIEHWVTVQESVKYWQQVFAEAYYQRVDTWDYQWVYAIWQQGGLCVLPAQNLITNIGFDKSATHTTLNSPFANMPVAPIYPIRHPKEVKENLATTNWLFHRLYKSVSRVTTFKNTLKRRLALLKGLWK